MKVPADRERNIPVFVAGNWVMMTAPQARRYEELRRAEASGYDYCCSFWSPCGICSIGRADSP